MVEHEFPVVLGRDYAGVVEQVGARVTRHAAGSEVYGFLPHANPTVHDGSWTELIVVPEDNFVARKPVSVELAAAGAAPLAGITALAAVDALDVSAGDTVLVVGATGGVGSFAVQLAAHAGATVIAPALPEDDEYLRGLGVSEVLDRDADTAAAVRERHPDGVDALLDVVSYAPDGFDANAAALKPGGRGASPVSAAGDGPGRRGRWASSWTRPSRSPGRTPGCAGCPTTRSWQPARSPGPGCRCGSRPPTRPARGASTRPAPPARGLRCRPLHETVRDTWTWLRDGGGDELGDYRSSMRPTGLTAEQERALLGAAPG